MTLLFSKNGQTNVKPSNSPPLSQISMPPNANRSGDCEDATTISVGFTPRVVPKPAYPSPLNILRIFIFDVFWQAGVWGTLLFMFLFPHYEKIHKYCINTREMSEPLFFCLMTSISHSVCYVCFNLVYEAFDKFELFQKYKMLRKEGWKPRPALRKKLFVEAAIGQLLTSPLSAYYLYPAFKYFGMHDFTAPLPSPASLFFTFTTAHIFNDFGFYITHRASHSSWIYQRIHKQYVERALSEAKRGGARRGGARRGGARRGGTSDERRAKRTPRDARRGESSVTNPPPAHFAGTTSSRGQ